MRRIIESLNIKATNSIKNFGAQYDAFSIFIFIFYLANPLKWHFSGPYSFSIIFLLRAIAVLLWFTLAMWRWWPNKYKEYLPIFWHFALLYHLPFRTTFSLLYSQHSPSFDSFGLLGIVALALLVNDRIFCILTIVGSLLGCLVYFVFGGFDIPLVKVMTLLYASLMVISIAFIKLIFFRNHNLSLTEKIKANKIFAGAIAHEVRTPLSIINLSCENGDLNLIKKQARKSLSIVDSILAQIRYIESCPKSNCKQLALNDVLMCAYNDSYFSSHDRSKISMEVTKDISISADQVLLIQIFINLIKNALWAIKKSKDGQIKITADEEKDCVNISFTDNGIGIEEKFSINLFEPFHSSNENGVGIGLAFCKLALKNMNGSIECSSNRDGYTRFVVRLPKAVKAKKKEILNEVPTSMPVSHHDGAY